MPFKYKEAYLVYLCNEFYKSSIITFVETQKCAEKLALLLKFLGFKASCIHGGINQLRRLKILEAFKINKNQILIATDVASRGLDMPDIDLIVNFDIPLYARTYIHRVGRTARAGRSGRSVSLVSQYDIRSFQKIEKIVGRIGDHYNHNFDSVINIHRLVTRAKERCSRILKSDKIF